MTRLSASAGGQIHRIAAMPGASLHLDTLSRTLERIKFEQRLHDRDLGDVLGKSKDRAEAARKGEADISAHSFMRGATQWGADFAGPLLYHAGWRVAALHNPNTDLRTAPKVLTAALMKVINALESNNTVDPHELRDAAPEITQLGQLAEQLQRMLAAV